MTQITVETHRALKIKSRSLHLIARCELCGDQMQMKTENEAAILASIRSRDVCPPVQTAEVHLLQTADGLFVCLNSVIN